MARMSDWTVDPELLKRFASAILLGALIGVDREKKSSTGPRQFGGLRTFTLLGLGGALSAWLAQSQDLPALFVAGLLGLPLLLAASVWSAADREPGLTGEVAAVLTWLVGGACGYGHVEEGIVLGIATAGILAFKAPLHAAVQRLGQDDLTAILQLLFVGFVVLPFAPDTAVDPWGALVPASLGKLVVLISALSLTGWLAVKFLGEHRGQALTGLFGGLVSSTAVTLGAARQARAGSAGPEALAMSVLIAWTVMFARVAVEVAVVFPSLLLRVGPVLLAMAVPSAVAAAVAYRGSRAAPTTAAVAQDVALRNPFSLFEAAKVGAFFAGVLLVVAVVRDEVSTTWLYAVAALAGFTDVDAISLSMASEAKRGLDAGTASGAIGVAVVVNTGVKLGMAVAWGSRDLTRRLVPGTLAIGLGGLCGLAWAIFA